VLDKQNANARKGVMMIDASKGFIKDGNKNKLREQDIHKIVDAFDKLEDAAGYARMVPLDEIASDKNAYNLNLPRYIDSTEAEDIQDLQAHMTGGIPNRDLDALAAYWKVMPGLRNLLFKPLREGYAISRLGWIRQQQAALGAQARETPRQYVERESHYLWGRRYLLRVVESEGKPFVALDHKRITLTVRAGSDAAKRAQVLHEWHKGLLHAVVPGLLAQWQPRLGVQVSGYFLQRMKTQWGSCNTVLGNIRLNTELVKKPKDLLEYVIVHELAHLLEPTHSERFVALLDTHYPTWREARAELNELPLAATQAH
jgi:predicted metal-dependent hydrolase